MRKELPQWKKQLIQKIHDREYVEQWLKSHNYDPNIWEITAVITSAPKDKEIIVGEFVGVAFDRKKSEVKFARVSCIRNGRMFFNRLLKDKNSRKVFTLRYRTRRRAYLVLRTKREGLFFKSVEEEIFFRGMRFSPLVHLRDDPKEKWKEKCPFCRTAKNLTFDGGTEGGGGARDFVYVDFCEKCRRLLYFYYDRDEGPIVEIWYRQRIDETQEKGDRVITVEGTSLPAVMRF